MGEKQRDKGDLPKYVKPKWWLNLVNPKWLRWLNMVKPKYVFFLSILWMSAFILNIKESSWNFLKEAMTDLYVKESL